MPTEHEYKYVLSMDLVKEYTEDQLKAMADDHMEICQGYLAFSKGMTIRVRGVKTFSKKKWFLTCKQKVGDRVIEIEKKLDERDGGDLWEVCVGKLKKDRYVFQHDDATWELDLFKRGADIYFVMAEVELPEGAPRPTTMPEFMAKKLIYEVALTDDRFSNKRLGDVEYSTKLYQKLHNGPI
jgi:CYTH domain-containing protein